jgi:hypothetical protein
MFQWPSDGFWEKKHVILDEVVVIFGGFGAYPDVFFVMIFWWLGGIIAGRLLDETEAQTIWQIPQDDHK